MRPVGSYHYNPRSPLTRWQQEKVYALCGERHPILSRMRTGEERPTDRALLRHIERQIDWYELKEAKPGHDYMRAQIRKAGQVYRRLRHTAKLAGVELPTMQEALKALPP